MSPSFLPRICPHAFPLWRWWPFFPWCVCASSCSVLESVFSLVYVCVCVCSYSILIEAAESVWFCLYMGLGLTILHWTTNKGLITGERLKDLLWASLSRVGPHRISLSLLKCPLILPLFWAYFLQSFLGESCVTTDFIVFWLLCLLFFNIPPTTAAGAVMQMFPLGLSSP